MTYHPIGDRVDGLPLIRFWIFLVELQLGVRHRIFVSGNCPDRLRRSLFSRKPRDCPLAGLQDKDAEAALGEVAGKRSAAGAGSYYAEVILGGLLSQVRRGSSHQMVKRPQLAARGRL